MHASERREPQTPGYSLDKPLCPEPKDGKAGERASLDTGIIPPSTAQATRNSGSREIKSGAKKKKSVALFKISMPAIFAF